MYGAILGDIIGSPFEFDRGDKTKNFDLFSEGCGFTDDSVMTIAVGEALMAVGPKAAVKEIEEAVASNMQDWGKRYPHAGYGGSFRHWLKENNPKPYGSYGNGSAMRVSAAGWLYDSIERTREVARATANVTHNHPEGIKGAEAFYGIPAVLIAKIYLNVGIVIFCLLWYILSIMFDVWYIHLEPTQIIYRNYLGAKKVIKASDIYYFERNSNGSLIIVCSDRKGREWI